MKHKHTPGPYHVELDGCRTSLGLPIIAASNNHLIAEMSSRNEGNAYLLAAAPEMLNVLEIINGVLPEMARILHEHGFRDFSEEINGVREAISKAKGGK